MSIAHIVSRSRPASAVLGMFLIAGCASPGGSPDAARAPLLALAPAALGCEVAVQQRLTVELPGMPQQQLEALLEVDAHAVRLAFFVMGQGMGTMVWDGRQWDKQLSSYWPAQLAPEQVLSDLQLAFWPAQVVQHAFHLPWSVETYASGRRLLRDGKEHVRVQFIGTSVVEIIYPQGLSTLRVESPGGSNLCAMAKEPA